MNPNWSVTTVDQLFSIDHGKTVSAKNRKGINPKPFLRTSNVFWNRIDVCKVDEMDFTEEEFQIKGLRTGDMLVCEGGEIGRSAIWNGELKECSFQNHLHRLRPLSDGILPQFYVFWLLAGFKVLGLYEGVGNKTTIPNLSRGRLLALDVPRPSHQEQRSIATILSKVQEAVEVEGDLIRVTRELKQAALQKLFTEGLRGESQKETEIGLVPESWEPVLISELGTVVTGSTPPTKQREYYDGGVYDFISPGDLSGSSEISSCVKKISEKGLSVSRILPEGTTCFVCIGSSIGKVGITIQDKSTTNQQINSVIPNENYLPYFVFYLLIHYSGFISSHRSPNPVPIMSKGQFSAVRIFATSDIDEQREIASILQTVDNKIAHHESRQKLLQELFQRLLQDLMTGVRRVNELDVEGLLKGGAAC